MRYVLFHPIFQRRKQTQRHDVRIVVILKFKFRLVGLEHPVLIEALCSFPKAAAYSATPEAPGFLTQILESVLTGH